MSFKTDGHRINVRWMFIRLFGINNGLELLSDPLFTRNLEQMPVFKKKFQTRDLFWIVHHQRKRKILKRVPGWGQSVSASAARFFIFFFCSSKRKRLTKIKITNGRIDIIRFLQLSAGFWEIVPASFTAGQPPKRLNKHKRPPLIYNWENRRFSCAGQKTAGACCLLNKEFPRGRRKNKAQNINNNPIPHLLGG